jgi:hypothetical protein
MSIHWASKSACWRESFRIKVEFQSTEWVSTSDNGILGKEWNQT